MCYILFNLKQHENIKMTQLNFIAQLIISAFENSSNKNVNCAAYIAFKKETFKKDSKFDSLIKLKSLDDELLNLIADKLNCNKDELIKTVNFISKYF